VLPADQLDAVELPVPGSLQWGVGVAVGIEEMGVAATLWTGMSVGICLSARERAPSVEGRMPSSSDVSNSSTPTSSWRVWSSGGSCSN
jgi:hypothetical protein